MNLVTLDLKGYETTIFKRVSVRMCAAIYAVNENIQKLKVHINDTWYFSAVSSYLVGRIVEGGRAPPESGSRAPGGSPIGPNPLRALRPQWAQPATSA